MVRRVSDVVNTYWPGTAQIFGAWDFEPSWSSPCKAETTGCTATTPSPGRPGMYINASADGCPTSTANSGPCDNGWNQGWMWHLAWDHDPALPFPQIYATSGVNAHQWQLIDLYATTALGDGMFFFGTMSQYGACQQNGGCAGTDNPPHTAWDFLTWWLATDARTQQGEIDGLTDIRWNT